MTALRRLWCAVFGHAALSDPAWVIRYHCERCGRVVDGGLARRRQ